MQQGKKEVTSGIGFETAALFAREGCKVVCCDIDEHSGTKAVNRIQSSLESESGAGNECILNRSKYKFIKIDQSNVNLIIESSSKLIRCDIH